MDIEERYAKIEHQQTTLMLGYQQLNKELAHMSDLIEELDEVLRGDAAADVDGIVHQVHQLGNNYQELKASIWRIGTAQSEMQDKLRDIKEGREDRRTEWGNWTKIAVAAIMSGLLTHFWSSISDFVTKKSTDPVDQKIEEARHPRSIHRHYTIVEKAANDEE